MIHSVLITTSDGTVLVAKYWGTERSMNSVEARVKWEGEVFEATRDLWGEALDGHQQISTASQRFIVLQGAGELLFFACGSGEDDELVLGDFLVSVIEVVESVTKKPLNEEHVLDKYSKVLVSLDDMVKEGILDYTDDYTVSRLRHLKTPAE